MLQTEQIARIRTLLKSGNEVNQQLAFALMQHADWMPKIGWIMSDPRYVLWALEYIPHLFAEQFHKRKELLFHKTPIERFPQGLLELKGLKKLHLRQVSGLDTAAFFSLLTDHPSLEYLRLSWTDIAPLEIEFKEKQQLRKLHFMDNANLNLEHLFEQLARLPKLTHLSLECCKLKALPESVGELRDLRWLNLQGNPIFYFPESIQQLKKLKRVFVGAISSRYKNYWYRRGHRKISEGDKDLIRRQIPQAEVSFDGQKF